MQVDRIRKAVTEILLAIGEDPNREELVSTPDKVAEAYASFFKGIGVDPLSALGERFPAENAETVILKDIELVSICEHHLLPFTGVAHIAYLPNQQLAGLGRLAKVWRLLPRDRNCRSASPPRLPTPWLRA
jgi:GTP cyclohydrolase IA